MVAAIAGTLFSFSFEPFGLWFLAPISYAIFLHQCTSSSAKNLYGNAFLFGFVSSALTLWWAGKYVGLLPLAFLALLHGLFYLPLGLLGKYTHNILWFIPAILAIEEFRAIFPFGGFSWMRVAFSQADAPYSSVISIGGAVLLSAWVLVIASLMVNCRTSYLLVILLMIFIPTALNNSYSSSDQISFAGVQGNTPSVGLGFNDRAEAVFNLHLSQSKRVSSNTVDVIIWPENAVDVDPFANSPVSQAIENLTSTLSTPLIAGAITRINGRLENVSLMYDENGEVVSYYSKRYLTPFGEYIPLRPIARLVSPFVDDVSDFSVGTQRDIHRVSGFTLAPIICYELLSDSLVRTAARSAQALVAQTNSATFAGTAESSQQLNITRLRAQENAREIVSVSTVGISAHIDINGRILDQTDENVAAIIRGEVRANSGQTLANSLGGLAPVAVISLFTLLALFSVLMRIVRAR